MQNDCSTGMVTTSDGFSPPHSTSVSGKTSQGLTVLGLELRVACSFGDFFVEFACAVSAVHDLFEGDVRTPLGRPRYSSPSDS